MDPDHAGHEERLGVEDRPIDVGFGREVDDRVRLGDERPHDRRVGDIAAHEPEPAGLLRVVAYRGKVGLVARVRELVEDRDPRSVATRQHVPDVARPDEPGAAGDEQVGERPSGHPTGRSTGAASRPAASSSRASSAARSSDGTVPASAQWPS